MSSLITTKIEIFFSYAHKDRRLRDELENHLKVVRLRSLIINWYDGEICAGKEWEREIREHLISAQIILLLVSVDFLNSLYCSNIEMTCALQRHESGEARVIPVILRPVYWEDAPFAKLQVLPRDARPVTKWPNRDAAFRDVVIGIRKAILEITQH